MSEEELENDELKEKRLAALEKARAAQSESDHERLNPQEKAKANPKSRKAAMDGKCFECMGSGADGGWRERIGACDVEHCSLHGMRPYQALAARKAKERASATQGEANKTEEEFFAF